MVPAVPGGPGGPLGRAGFMLGQLDLTEAQKGQVKAIVEGHKADFQAIGARMREARQGLKAAMETTPVNADAIREATAALAVVQADANVHRASMRAEVLNILTDEQKAKAAELKARGEARRAAMRDRARNRVKAREAGRPQGGF